MEYEKLNLTPGCSGQEMVTAFMGFLSRSTGAFSYRGLPIRWIRNGRVQFATSIEEALPGSEIRLRRRNWMPVYASVTGVEQPEPEAGDQRLWAARTYLPTPEYGRDRVVVLESGIMPDVTTIVGDEMYGQRDLFGGTNATNEQATQRLVWFAEKLTETIRMQ